MAPDQLRLYIEAGAESPRQDYKRSSPCDADGLAKDILAMSTIKDGGRVVIGVAEQPDGSFEPTGVDPEHLATYKVDDLRDKVGAYADPYVDFDLEVGEVGEKKFIVITVHEFDEMPPFCKKDGPLKPDQSRELQKGRMYTRTRSGRAASVPVTTSTEALAIFKMAVDKGMSELHRRGYVFLPGDARAERGLDAQIAELS